MYVYSQVRVEGPVEVLGENDMKELYETEPLFCKIRAHICHQGKPVDWEQHKNNHDKLLQEFEENGHQLERPPHM